MRQPPDQFPLQLLLQLLIQLLPLFKEVYPKMLPRNDFNINMFCFMEDIEECHYQWLTSVKGFTTVSMDFTRGNTLALVRKFGFPATKTLGAGLIDSRGVWRVNPSVTKPIIDELKQLVKKIQVQVSQQCHYHCYCHYHHRYLCRGHVLWITFQKLLSQSG